MEKDKIMKILNSVENRTAYATSLKNAVRFHAASKHKMHFWGLFPIRTPYTSTYNPKMTYVGI